jgi:hypothetical protein
VYPLPEGGATHALLVATGQGGAHARALLVTPPPAPTALVQRAALRVSFLQLDDVDGAFTTALKAWRLLSFCAERAWRLFAPPAFPAAAEEARSSGSAVAEVLAPEEHQAHALVLLARARCAHRYTHTPRAAARTLPLRLAFPAKITS